VRAEEYEAGMAALQREGLAMSGRSSGAAAASSISDAVPREASAEFFNNPEAEFRAATARLLSGGPASRAARYSFESGPSEPPPVSSSSLPPPLSAPVSPAYPLASAVDDVRSARSMRHGTTGTAASSEDLMSGGGLGVSGMGVSGGGAASFAEATQQLRFENGAVVSMLGSASERTAPLAKVFSIARLTERPRGRGTTDSKVISSIIFPGAGGPTAMADAAITLPSGAPGGGVGGGPAFVTSAQAGLSGGHPSTSAPHLQALHREVAAARQAREAATRTNGELETLLKERAARVNAEERRFLMASTASRADATVTERRAYAAFLHRERMGTAPARVGSAAMEGDQPPKPTTGSRGRHTLTSAELNARPGSSMKRLFL